MACLLLNQHQCLVLLHHIANFERNDPERSNTSSDPYVDQNGKKLFRRVCIAVVTACCSNLARHRWSPARDMAFVNGRYVRGTLDSSCQEWTIWTCTDVETNNINNWQREDMCFGCYVFVRLYIYMWYDIHARICRASMGIPASPWLRYILERCCFHDAGADVAGHDLAAVAAGSAGLKR